MLRGIEICNELVSYFGFSYACTERGSRCNARLMGEAFSSHGGFMELLAEWGQFCQGSFWVYNVEYTAVQYYFDIQNSKAFPPSFQNRISTT